VLVLVLLSLGLGTLLLLNTLLAQGSFTLHELEAKVADLADQEQALQQKAAALAAPQRLARSATELGMVPSVNPAFLRAEDGKVLGAPVPAAGPPPVVGSEPEAGGKPNTDTSTSASTGAGADADADAGQVSGEQQASQDQHSQQTRQGEQTGNNETGNEGADR
jgi:hypothetical protein